MRFLQCGLVLLLGIRIAAAEETDRFSDERVVAFQQELEGILKATEIPGLGAALVTPDRVVWAGGIGLADVESGTPVTAETIFRVGSISKTLVGLSAMMAVEGALLDLRQPVRELIPEIEFKNPWEGTDPLRFVHLLEHSAGWEDLTLREFAHNEFPPLSLREGLEVESRSRTSRWPPGRSMSYSNCGIAAAAYAIEKVVEKDFEAFVEERVFAPLEMSLSSFRLTPELRRELATGYTREAAEATSYWHLIQRPSGALNSSPQEMANYLQMFLREGEWNGERLVKPESIDRMGEPPSTRAVRTGAEIWYGLGLMRYVSGRRIWYGHSGYLEGYQADFAWCPDLEVGYVFMINRTPAPGFRVLREKFREFLMHGQEIPTLPPPVKVDSALLSSYAGFYEPITPRSQRMHFLWPLSGVVRVVPGANGEGLHHQQIRIQWRRIWENPFEGNSKEFVAVSDHLFRRKEDPMPSMVFYKEEEGTASFSVSGEYRKVSERRVWAHWVVLGASALMTGSTILFALIWIPRRWFSQSYRSDSALWIRLFPLLCALSVLATWAAIRGGLQNELTRLGAPTLWSIGLAVGTILIALTSGIGVLWCFLPNRRVGWILRLHSLLTTGLQVTVVVYLFQWGIIGYCSWR